jgi:hypothetical protein
MKLFWNSFPIHIDTNETIEDIRRAIKRETNYEYPADELTLWKVNIIPPDGDALSLEAVIDSKYIKDIEKEELLPYHFVSRYFHDSSNIIRIIVHSPPSSGKSTLGQAIRDHLKIQYLFLLLEWVNVN